MKRAVLCIIIVAAAGGGFLAGGIFSRQAPGPEHTVGSSHLHGSASSQEISTDLADMPPGTVAISPERQQAIGVRAEQVAKKPYTHTVRLLGRVVADETRTYFINATIDGWVTRTYPNTTGSFVKKNETLAAFYSSEFLSAGQALLFALSSMDRVHTTGRETEAQTGQLTQFKINLQQYRDSLRNLGMGDLQIEEMIRTRRYMENVNVTSPGDGIILNRNVSLGQRFDKGTELYRIADISRVWILADAYQADADSFLPKAVARVTQPQRMQTFEAQVSTVPPVFDPATRTLKVRLEADNPGYLLRPEMFVDVELSIERPAAIVVPADAVLDSGMQRTVFVLRGEGLFEPRPVKTGRRLRGAVEIVEGLSEGERIVTSGNFLIDSESKLTLAASGMQALLAKDPVCGLEVSPHKAAKAGWKSTHAGKSYYFCSDEHRREFEKNPAQHAARSE
jgi:membrane fusion protein, copper/silver efflux system